MSANQYVLVHGMRRTRSTLARWGEEPWPVIRSWLLELAGDAFEREGNDLADIRGWVADSGEGRWTVADAIEHDVPAPIITLALLQRLRSRREPDSFTDRVLAALRNEFGGHAVKSAGEG